MPHFCLSNYPNLLHHVPLSWPAIEAQISHYTLSFLDIRAPDVEWQMRFPAFLKPFYKYVWQHQYLPTQENYWRFYLLENSSFFDQTAFDAPTLLALQARVFRTYPSLVRDIHFVFYLHAHLPRANVLYNTELDVINGIDLLIEYQQQFWGFNLYTPTHRAQVGRAKKQHRHAVFDNVQYHDLPVLFDTAHRHGHFFLYGVQELSAIKQLIDYQ